MTPEPRNIARTARSAVPVWPSGAHGDPGGDPSHVAWQRARRDLRLTRALASRFPALAGRIGATLFPGLARAFIDASPPRSAVLIDWGAAMAAFLQEFGPTRATGFLPDLARLEWARWQAFHAADARPMATDELAAAATIHAEPLFLRLHPSVQALASHHPVVSIWERSFPPKPESNIPAWVPEAALVARVGDDVTTDRISVPQARFIEALRDGATLAAARRCARKLAPDFDSAPILDLLVGRGLVTGAC